MEQLIIGSWPCIGEILTDLLYGIGMRFFVHLSCYFDTVLYLYVSQNLIVYLVSVRVKTVDTHLLLNLN